MNNFLLDTREDLIEQNMGLVHSCAHRFKGRGIEYEDLFQAGCMGLIKAVDAFDTGRGVKFSTYAVPVILGEMRRLFRDGGSIKVSRSLKELSLKANRMRERFAADKGREPTISELAGYLEIDTEQAAEVIMVSQPVMSLTDDREDSSSGQFDIPIPSIEEDLADHISLKEVMAHLEEKDQMLIHYRYFQGKTQTETAKFLGMTQVQVSRREKKILTKLRKELST